MNLRTDPFRIQNDWQARQHHDEMEDRVPQLPTFIPQDHPEWWEEQAQRVWKDLQDGNIGVNEAVGTLYAYVFKMGDVARKYRGDRPTEAELHDDSQHAQEGE
jgi:hypothetical protein